MNNKYPTNDNRKWYREIYLKTDHWRNLRSDKIRAVKGKCEKCLKSVRLDVHHIQYRNLFDVTLSDLQALCRRCHNLEHDLLASLDTSSKRRKAKVKQLKEIIKDEIISPIQKDDYWIPHITDKILDPENYQIKEWILNYLCKKGDKSITCAEDLIGRPLTQTMMRFLKTIYPECPTRRRFRCFDLRKSTQLKTQKSP